MSDGDDQQLPPRRNLPMLAYSIISNLEDLLQLRYPTGSLTSSENIQESPTFAIAIKAILALSPCQTTHNERVLAIVRQWLQISDAELPSPDEVSEILEQPNILNEIYGRGLANHFPPVYNLLKPTRRRKCEEIKTNYKNIMIEGELSDTICFKTSPLQTAWMSVSSIVQPISASMRHRIQVMIEEDNEVQENQQQIRQSQPVTILIYNAKGILRPSFLPTIARNISTFNPSIVIVTETRACVGQIHVTTHCLNQRILQCIDPIRYLGGSCIMYDATQLWCLPERHNLSVHALSIIENLEDQLRISYHTGQLTQSEEIQRELLLEHVVKAILAFPSYRTTRDENINLIIRSWLGITDRDLPSIDETRIILHQSSILTKIYSRCLANKTPHLFTLSKPTHETEFVTAEPNFTHMTVKGEIDRVICVNTRYIFRAWISISGRIDSVSGRAKHNIQIMLDASNSSTSHSAQQNQISLSSPQSMNMLIYNARGITRPSFFPTLHDSLTIHRPAVAIVTETRLRVRIEEIEAQFDNYRFLHCINPHGYLGGSWFIFDQNQCSARIVNAARRDITAEISLG
ncbi:hypothetical protein COLO4_06620 [Corchorus olitorius]|uniref:Endonuclease/exonuclease/phosphatase n=1 Tax=Corchorus olitorius TaxID=93759 RepID=A0A1R3KMF5_9ROSI|nr:hypothetical protein COLO4_06620 [Corchorus olitorius]